MLLSEAKVSLCDLRTRSQDGDTGEDKAVPGNRRALVKRLKWLPGFKSPIKDQEIPQAQRSPLWGQESKAGQSYPALQQRLRPTVQGNWVHPGTTST